MPDLLPYAVESAIPGTLQSYVYALYRKYGSSKKYVTLESASNRILSHLASHYKVTSAGYRNMSDTDDSGRPGEILYSHLVVLDTAIDAMYFDISGSCGTSVVIFFDDPMELEKLRAPVDYAEVGFGTYQLAETATGYALSPVTMSATERPILDPEFLSNLITDTDTFFESREFYEHNNIDHKRGILIIGPPGNGKTMLIKHFLTRVKEKFSIIMDCSTTYFGAGLFHYLKAMFGPKDKIFIFEDVDGVTSSYSSRSAFLNFLDGPRQLINTLSIATTNYPERLDAAILDRPSRFDAIYFLGTPSLILRKEFLIHWFPELVNSGERLEALALATEGFSGAFFKELFTLAWIRKCSVEAALEALNARRKMIQKFRALTPQSWSDKTEMEDVSGIHASLHEDSRIPRELAINIIAASKRA